MAGRYLCRRSVTRDRLQLLGVAALLIAGKHEEVKMVVVASAAVCCCGLRSVLIRHSRKFLPLMSLCTSARMPTATW